MLDNVIHWDIITGIFYLKECIMQIISKKAQAEGLVGKVLVCGGGEVVLVQAANETGSSVSAAPFLLSRRAYPADLGPLIEDGVVVYEFDEAMQVFKTHIERAQAAGMWSDPRKAEEAELE